MDGVDLCRVMVKTSFISMLLHTRHSIQHLVSSDYDLAEILQT